MDTAPLPPACSYLETVGNTPMVKLDRCVPAASKQATILCKLEMQNPGGSLKDRIALNMIEEAEARGDITPGKTTIIDFTSGNTGIGYAMVAAAKGYKCIVIMPKVRPMLERYLICRQFGAEVHLFNPSLGAPGALKYVKDQLAANPHYWWPNQLGNPDNPAVHERTTGPEIWKLAGGAVDYFIHGIGTGGCVAGVGKYLKSVNPKCRVIALEPTEARVHTGASPKPHGVVGWAPGVHSQFLDGFGKAPEELSDAPRGVVDEWGHVATSEAVATCLQVTSAEGMMVGPSSGAAIKYAFDVAARPEAKGSTIVVVLPSHGIRYVAHPLWAAVNAEANEALPPGEAPCSDKEQPILLWASEEYKKASQLPSPASPARATG
ncbi:cysteine synthase [Emiliania huxleyi CCMP1516]|uniref:Tryptophan synthase beta chain-like PALP domain-containing protein n=2 Tax=Emiliania huxleyi TaxID=2903 RepID=A0A0D3J930_EMIH1|nr:cysteine synthase [Emiliania huxleyi CCMP1516]EOD20015.1 cysteine synthase [Emiliania huxleyi CCMP1516]|eukprot:XP_005772444.1 cysteine synthase [Emiliania huxleyi CCMP1516]